MLRPALARPFLSRVPLPLVTAVVVANRTLGSGETSAGVTSNGRFSTTLATSAGINQLWARVTLSDGATAEREWAFEFDDTIVRERLIAEEREHMRRVREKRLRLTPVWDETLPPPDAAPAPE